MASTKIILAGVFVFNNLPTFITATQQTSTSESPSNLVRGVNADRSAISPIQLSHKSLYFSKQPTGNSSDKYYLLLLQLTQGVFLISISYVGTCVDIYLAEIGDHEWSNYTPGKFATSGSKLRKGNIFDI